MTSVAFQRYGRTRQAIPHGSGPAGREDSDDIVFHVENHLESWRHIVHFIGLARGKRFDSADEDHFLELKGVIVQELELILSSGECSSPAKDDVHTMMNNAPSLRSLSQLNEGALRNLEHQWHLIYIGWHATLGQLKVKHRTLEALHPRTGLLQRWSSW
jgi:hypothetical protein